MVPWLDGTQQRRRAHSHSAHHQHVLARPLGAGVQSTKPEGGERKRRRREAGQHTPKWDSLVVGSRARECGWASVIDSAMLCCGMSSRAGSARLRVGWIDSVPASQLELFSRFIIGLLLFFFLLFFLPMCSTLEPPLPPPHGRPNRPSHLKHLLVHTQFWARGTEFALHHPSVNSHLSASRKKLNSTLDLSGKP